MLVPAILQLYMHNITLSTLHQNMEFKRATVGFMMIMTASLYIILKIIKIYINAVKSDYHAYICKTHVDVRSLIYSQSSNPYPIST